MKRVIITATMAVSVFMVAAQDTYESARLLGGDLNGTARYVGMGGAMEALGADISTISTNPAGIGMFRHSFANASVGVVSQENATTFDGLSKTNFSIDQAGFVYSMQTGYTSYVNFGFNFHKSRNFDQILSAVGRIEEASSNMITYAKDGIGNSHQGGFYTDFNKDGDLMGWENATSDMRAQTFSQLDYLNANGVLYEEEGNDWYLLYGNADSYTFNRSHRGWIGDFEFNLSGNINNRVYLGLTVGIHTVNYHGYSAYRENMVDGNNNPSGYISYYDERKVKGDGADVKLGAIFRPVEESPFRIGVYVHTPTWYSLETSNHTEIYNEAYGSSIKGQNAPGFDSYKFKFYTPWKFGLSLGHTFDNLLAVGATYEYCDYSASDIRVNLGIYDSYGKEKDDPDRNMNDHLERTLKGVSTLKLGAELKPDKQLAIRMGYNYVSPMYDSRGFRDTQIESNGVMYASTSDYVNWKDTHRITCGLGYRTGPYSIDLAYQYSMQKGDFYPFQNQLTYKNEYGTWVTDTDLSKPTTVENNRHQVLLTLGYTF